MKLTKQIEVASVKHIVIKKKGNEILYVRTGINSWMKASNGKDYSMNYISKMVQRLLKQHIQYYGRPKYRLWIKEGEHPGNTTLNFVRLYYED
jgi:hypothetical protein